MALEVDLIPAAGDSWGPIVRWSALFEAGYHATALITAKAQRRCLKYILSQSVKEGLVGHPAEWPGLHCADSLMTGRPIKGVWFNGTDYGTNFHRAKRRGKQTEVRREDYVESCEAWFDPLPCMTHLSQEQRQRDIATMVEEIVHEARSKREGRPPMGLEALARLPRMTRSALPPPPWFETRRRMIVWDDPRDPQVRTYKTRYWDFQDGFRMAAKRWASGELAVAFPSGSFRPGLSRPVPHIFLSS